MPSTTALPGYSSEGPRGKRTNVVELVGPASYAAGGQALNASQFGQGGFDYVECGGLSYSSTYYGRVQYRAVDAAPSALKGAVALVHVIWYTRATDVEVVATTDLSGEILRVFMVLV